MKELADRVLPELGFFDTISEHPWNAVHYEKRVDGWDIVAWCDHGDASLNVQIYEDYERMIHLCKVREEQQLREIIGAVETMLNLAARLKQ